MNPASQSAGNDRRLIFFRSTALAAKDESSALTDACRRALQKLCDGAENEWQLAVAKSDPLASVASRLGTESKVWCELLNDADSARTASAADVWLIVSAGDAAGTQTSVCPSSWITVDAVDGRLVESPDLPTGSSPQWLAHVYAAAGVRGHESLPELFDKLSRLADALAPKSRRLATGLVIVEGVAVLLALLWLLRYPLGIQPLWAALAGLVGSVLVVTFCWWYRWRGMARLWARARMATEVCRSLLATQNCPTRAGIRQLDVIPSLRPLFARFGAEPEGAAPDWIESYLKHRLQDQIAYYRTKRDAAVKERAKLTKWSTIFMDCALVVGVGGVIVAMHPRSAGWLDSVFGGFWLDLGFGLLGLALPLCLLMLQSFRLINESSRRTARYTQQLVVLEAIERRLASSAPNSPEAIEALHQSEYVLMSEVVDWYYQAETSEDFYHSRKHRETAEAAPSSPVKLTPDTALLSKAGTRIGSVTGFLLRLVLGRLIWMLIAAALVIAWVNFRLDVAPKSKPTPLELGHLFDARGSPFRPDPSASNGTVVVVHGMRDGLKRPRVSGTPHWSVEICDRIRQRLGPSAPQMIILDWHELAEPSRRRGIHLGDSATGMIADVGAIRPQAYEVGYFMGTRLALLAQAGAIHTNRPLHLIGHSAGGFVVTRVAHVLRGHGVAPAELHVTILDTPVPDAQITESLGAIAKADFYATSAFVQISSRDVTNGLHFVRINPPPAVDPLKGAHSYAWQWYRDSITNAVAGQDGFGRSPLMLQR